MKIGVTPIPITIVLITSIVIVMYTESRYLQWIVISLWFYLRLFLQDLFLEASEYFHTTQICLLTIA